MNLEGLGGGKVVYFHNKIPCTALEKKRKSLLSWLLTQCGPGVHGAPVCRQQVDASA